MNLNADITCKTVKMLSWSGFIALCAIDITVSAGKFGAEQLAADMLYAVLVLMLSPDGCGRPQRSLILAVLALLICAASAIVPYRESGLGISLRTAVPAFAVIVLTQVDIAIRTSCRYRNVRSLFKSSQVLDNIADHARMQRCMILYVICALLLMATATASAAVSAVLRIISMLVLAIMFVLAIMPGSHFIFMDSHKYLQVLAMAKGKLKDSFLPEEVEGKDMGLTYKKAQDCMENSRSYLNPDLSLEDMARMIGTNKVYLSRAINIVSGRNFCQFVNYYRVQYAKAMMLKEPGCKMIDVAMASGFHSVVTFNMAFKVNEELTPSEWVREYRTY